MSLVTDTGQLLGTGSVPVVVAGTVLGVFELGERLASQRAEDALSKWLLTFELQKAKELPDGTQELFERIFGERHLSLKCFIRSAAFSLTVMVFIAILVFMIKPEEVFKMMTNIFFGHGLCVQFPDQHHQCDDFHDWVELVLWVPCSILIDYISLLKTRIILRVFTRLRRRSSITAVAIIGIDFIVYKLIFSLGFGLMTSSVMVIVFRGWPFVSWLDLFRFKDIMDNNLILIFFWSGFAPSIWMWLYVAALFTTRALLRTEKLVIWLRWFLDVERNPFRSIGAVAAALAFLAPVAVILLSAEISRISGAA